MIVMKVKAAAPATDRTQLGVRIYTFPRVGVADKPGEETGSAFWGPADDPQAKQREMCRISR
jgi:hypothetical protein